MKKLILIRHGESEWNKLNLFTGWTNVDLSEKGVQEAIEAGKTLKENGYKPEICFTSYLKRAIKTLNLALEAMDMDWLPVYKSWRLNEKSLFNIYMCSILVFICCWGILKQINRRLVCCNCDTCF